MTKKRDPLFAIGWVGDTKKCGKVKVIAEPFEGKQGGAYRWRYPIRFLTTGFETHVSEYTLVNETANDPYRPKIAGVGFIGEGKYRTRDGNTKMAPYRCWENMMYRVYGEHRLSNRYAERGVSVCKEWHNLQNFGPWFDAHYRDGFVLDKDILIPGNKEYSPEACVFIPQELNKFFCAMNKRRGDLPVGVCSSKGAFWARVQFRDTRIDGVFATSEKAFEFYKENKERVCKQMADQLHAEGKISEEIHHQLYNWVCVPYPD